VISMKITNAARKVGGATMGCPGSSASVLQSVGLFAFERTISLLRLPGKFSKPQEQEFIRLQTPSAATLQDSPGVG
jgi:hypothetical protein